MKNFSQDSDGLNLRRHLAVSLKLNVRGQYERKREEENRVFSLASSLPICIILDVENRPFQIKALVRAVAYPEIFKGGCLTKNAKFLTPLCYNFYF